MAVNQLSVLLRNGAHGGANVTRYMLKVEQFTIAIQRTPIQVALPSSDPVQFDLGINRPSITVSGLVDNIGGDPTNTTNASPQYYGGMSWVNVTAHNNGHTNYTTTQAYAIPYKNHLEQSLVAWASAVDSDGNPKDIEIEVGDAKFPMYDRLGDGHKLTGGDNRGFGTGNMMTGGAIYKCVVGTVQFSLAPGTEDRWMFSVQLPCKTPLHTDWTAGQA